MVVGIVQAGSEITCNAHIELQSEEAQVSFDKMSLEVYSPTGAKQESSQCTPDGSCFIVIYNRDQFLLRMKGPSGAVFEPEEYKIDSKSKCEDLPFKLKGFSLNLSVKAKNQEGQLIDGPKDIGFELRKLSKVVTKPLAINTTNEQGQVQFDQIAIPDRYVVSVAPTDNITFSNDKIECDFKWETGFKCEKNHFLITGFTISGSVLSYQDPMPNVNVYLYTGDASIKEKGKNSLKANESDSDGVYRFDNMPVGSYQIVAVYSENQAKFQVEPEVLKATIVNSPVHLEPFHVIGFSIFGKVVNHKSEGIKGVKILIDGQQRATTNEKGIYKLDEITPGSYMLEGVATHYFFDSMNINVKSTSRQMPNLVVTDYHLCGKIFIDHISENRAWSVSKRNVALSVKNKGERRTSTDENGEFCFEVKPGTYSVSPIITAEEKEKGLKLIPIEKQVIISNEPVLNLNFTQSKLSISGSIKCLEQEDQKCVQMKVQLLNKGKIVETEQVNEKGQFKFSKILPGRYLLKVQIEEFCWQQERFDIDVHDEDIKDINFIQTGYSMPYESTHTFDVKIKKGKGTSIERKKINEGKNNKLCFEQRGSYTITPDSCYKFESEHFQFNTSASQRAPLTFKPTHFKVEGKLLLKEDDQVSKINMTVQTKGEPNSQESLTLKKSNETIYTFEYYTVADKNLVIEPVLLKGSNLLFYPKSKEIIIDDECVNDIKFEAKSGLMISGKIDPPTGGVLITIRNNVTEDEVNVTSDASGNYKAGPLYDDQVYEINAYKEDYIFKKEGNTTFKAQKLSSLVITVKEKDGKPLESVFLSLSAGKFRVTGTTNSKGQFKFVGLNQGKFYVTAILKEYEFDQSQIGIDLQDGEHTEKTLTAKRVAFSAYGSVTKLNGLPLEQARIVAKCEDCDKVEETVIDQDGNYRIRGLSPGHKYQLSVVSDIIERTVPNIITIDVKQQDTKAQEFLAIMQSPYVEISGSVNFEGEDPALVFKEDPKAVVELYETENLDQPIQSWQLSLSRYFQFSSLPRKEYILKVVPKRGPTDKRYESTIFKVNEQGGYHALYVPSRSKQKESIKRTALLGPLLVASLIFLYIYQDKVSQIFGSGPQYTPSSQPNSTKVTNERPSQHKKYKKK